MKSRQRDLTILLLSAVTIALLFIIYQDESIASINPVSLVLFIILLTYTSIYGIPFGSGKVSLVPMLAFSSLMVMRPFASSLAIIISDLFYGLIRYYFKEKVGWNPNDSGFSLLSATTANISMHVWSLLASGYVYQALGAKIPVQNARDLAVILAVAVTFIIVNYLFAGLFMLMLSKGHLQYFLRNLSQMLFYEALPMFFAPLVAITLTDLGVMSFIILAVVMMLFASILRDQVNAHNRLERRVLELSSLQAVGKSLSTSLDIEEITDAIYEQVSRLTNASNFYVALYDPINNEIVFPSYYEMGERIEYPARKARKNGLTEYVLNTCSPLLIKNDFRNEIQNLGIVLSGKEPYSWLGVPIMAGSEPIGVMTVQTYPSESEIPESYDLSHQDILTTIAAQASVAIQNARLYAKIDQALEQRVQELNSILSTANEGIMLLNTDMTVLQVNRALSNILNTSPSNILNHNLAQDDNELLNQLKIEDRVLDDLIAGENETHQSKIRLTGKGETPVERTVTPVLGEANLITGWLVVYRDLTEEIELELVREDMTRMLVHDLRSPIVSIQGGLDMIEVMINDNDKEALLEMLEISRKGSHLILGMINQILNLNKMESGEFTLHPEPFALPSLLSEERSQFKSILEQNSISLSVDFDNELPVVHADRDLMTRVLHNLLDNAIKYSENGGEVVTWGKPDEKDCNYVLFGVKDNGSGIPNDIMPYLFDKYFTSQHAPSRRKGTGLGLYFCKMAVEAHGGNIWVESIHGQGSNFIIRMPVGEPEEKQTGSWVVYRP